MEPKRSKMHPYWCLLPNELKLEVASCLDQRALSRLTQVNRRSHELLNPTLYRRDVLLHNCKALKWAAWKSGDGKYDPVIRRTLRLALKNGAKINTVHAKGEAYATTLHMAAALGNTSFVELLLKKGARLDLPSQGLYQFLPDCNNRIKEKVERLRFPYSLQKAILCRTAWYPLLVPFLFNDTSMITLLREKGASAKLALELKKNGVASREELRHVTIHHILAATGDLPSYDENGDCLFRANNDCIDDRLLGNGFTALHVAIEACKPANFCRLLQAGADMEAVSDFHKTPLIQAVDCANMFNTIELNAPYAECIEELILRGANIHVVSHTLMAETALSSIMKSALHNSQHPTGRMQAIVKLLVRAGADVNHRAANGRTAIHDLFELICLKEKKIKQEEELFKFLVEHGGDVNIPFPGGKSLLRMSMVEHDMKPLKAYELVMRSGGVIFSHEVDAVFKKWIKSSKLRSAGFDMRPHIRKISQRAIDDVYLETFDGKPNEPFRYLRAHFPVTTIAEELVADMIMRGGPKLSEATLNLRFDPNWIDLNGDSFLHLIVNRIDSNPHGRATTALADTMALVDKGARVTHRNSQGLTVIQRLRDSGKQYDTLRLFLYEQKDIEKGEF
ncbi:hypothetical protein PT974_03969 [Cladobotryum mycophilum]|uniref:F-box domain-containing protein n=1 Tax=Cladobotryum mycophilum TaxID=491253 RepID=A0ABR0STT4_9HYPO